MRVIGVLDLLAGRAVHALAGRRDRYEPVRTAGGMAIEPGDAAALARTYLGRLGLTELYAADLDAILGRPRQDTLVRSLAGLGAPLWLDAGARSVLDARHALEVGATVVIIGLETLPSYEALAEVCASLGSDRVAFSLDLHDGTPIVASSAVNQPAQNESAHVVARRAADAGVGAIIIIDLARVGTGTGLDLALIGRVRDAAAGVTLLAGGGVRGAEDLARLANAGCDGALVATALHDGRLGAEQVTAAGQLHRHARR